MIRTLVPIIKVVIMCQAFAGHDVSSHCLSQTSVDYMLHVRVFPYICVLGCCVAESY